MPPSSPPDPSPDAFRAPCVLCVDFASAADARAVLRAIHEQGVGDARVIEHTRTVRSLQTYLRAPSARLLALHGAVLALIGFAGGTLGMSVLRALAPDHEVSALAEALLAGCVTAGGAFAGWVWAVAIERSLRREQVDTRGVRVEVHGPADELVQLRRTLFSSGDPPSPSAPRPRADHG